MKKRKSKANGDLARTPTNGADTGKNGTSKDEKENVKSSPKMNAFEFMMHSRNKSIGRNSPGRDIDVNESTESPPKQELKARRSRLQNWADQKGAAKRKRDEEIGETINYKLEKRERVLKKMLKINGESDEEVVTKRRRKCAVIDTDSESSNDAKEQTGNGNGSLSSDKNNESPQVELTPKSVNSWRFKIKLCMEEAKNMNGQEEEHPVAADGEVTENEIEAEPNMCIEEPEEEHAVDTNGKVTENEVETPSTPESCTLDESVIIIEENTDTNNQEESKRVLRTRRSQPKHYEDYFLSDEEDNPKGKKKTKKDVKVAPVFLKAVPKPKLDPEVAEARRQFLLSGVPSSLKKEMERQQCIEEADFDVFPSVSHVQQMTPDSPFWHLPPVQLPVKNRDVGSIEVTPFSNLVTVEADAPACEKIPLKKIKNIKKVVTDIKTQHPDYPVFKIFNSIHERSGHKSEVKQVTKRRGRPKKSLDKVELAAVSSGKDGTHEMWTEKYKPKLSSDIIGNHNSVKSLKEWLVNWITVPKSCRNYVDSESEFDVTDGDSRDSGKLLGNTVILKGPSGSGKTAAVYAVCNELGLEVLELNASSKRTGKRLQQELQEATQSHQVCKKESIFSFVKEKKDVKSTKMCVLLIEDIDVVFDQDEGFSAALLQVISTTKRPIILTLTDHPGGAIQKIVNNYRIIPFQPLSSILALWLQIVCVVEGLYLDLQSLDDLLRFNSGDIRRTLLQLQLYVNSGGQRSQKTSERTRDLKFDNSVTMDDSTDAHEEIHIHRDCLDTCQPVRNFGLFSLPPCTNLEVLWWNLPHILGLPGLRVGSEASEPQQDTHLDKLDRQQLRMLSDCFDNMSFVDLTCGSKQVHETLKPKWRTTPKSGLGLEETKDTYRDDELNHDLAQTLLSGCLKRYKENWNNALCDLNLALPLASEQKWRAKQISNENKLEDALLCGDSLWRKAVSLDYLPSLRSIARSELVKMANNNKRGNRFYSYLKGLGVRGGESIYKTASSIFGTLE